MYYISENGRILGPLTLEQLSQRAQRNELSLMVPVCLAGTENWQPLHQVLGLPPSLDEAPLRQGAPPPKKSGLGCFAYGCLGTIAFLVLVVLAIVYTVFYTAVPLRMFTQALAEQENLTIEGVSGSLSSGISIEHIQGKTADGGSVDIHNLRAEYNGFFDFINHQRFIIREISVAKAHLVFSSLESSASSSSTSSSTPDSTPATRGEDFPLFRIDLIRFGDVYIKDLRTGFELTMPAFEYGGLVVSKDKVNLGHLTVESDRLDLRTSEGSAPYQKRLSGTLKPLLHPSIQAPIPFTVDVGLSEDGHLSFLLNAFEGKLQALLNADESGYVRTRDLFLGASLKIADYDLPEHLTSDVTLIGKTAQEPASLRVESGRFRLGMREFEIQPATYVTAADESVKLQVEAVSPGEAGKIIARLTVLSDQDSVQGASTTFKSIPEMPLPEILATLFYGKSYEALNPEERQQTDRRVKRCE